MKDITIGGKIWIIGPPGSGKSTLASKLSVIYNIAHYELDNYYWKENWERNSKDDFRMNIVDICNKSKWIIDGQYPIVTDIIASKADTIIWLDESLTKVIIRVLRRSLFRIIKRNKLWHGNVENVKMVLGEFIPYIIASHETNRNRNLKLFQVFLESDISLLHVKSIDEVMKYIS